VNQLADQQLHCKNGSLDDVEEDPIIVPCRFNSLWVYWVRVCFLAINKFHPKGRYFPTVAINTSKAPTSEVLSIGFSIMLSGEIILDEF